MAVDLRVATQRAEARVGSVINDKWRLDRLLGVGGMACVYAATHRNKKRAAVKMLHPELSLDSALRQRFLREGYVANSVGHRGAVTVDDDDVSEDGSAFIVMELLDGETIEQRWRRKRRCLPLEEVLAIGDQVLDTLAAAHEKGVVHRDLKPENLFLTRDGVVKLLDFGIGRVRELRSESRSTTQAGATMGTPAFMAPEQARGRWDEVDGQTDLWALGATLFTLLTGEYVHEGETVNETLALAVTRPARSIRGLRPDLPPPAIALIDRALAYTKPQRFSDARGMQAELRATYAALAGKDVRRAAQLSVPDAEPTAAPSSALPELADPRRRLTTARGVTATDQPPPNALRDPRKSELAALLNDRRALLVTGGVLLLLAVLVLVARGTSEPPAPLADATVASASPALPKAAQPLPAPLLPSSQLPAVSIDELPRETRKKASGAAASESRGSVPGAAAPAAPPRKDSDPFARRR